MSGLPGGFERGDHRCPFCLLEQLEGFRFLVYLVVPNPSIFNQKDTYCGWTKSCTTWKQGETIDCWYLQGNRLILGFLRWCEMDFVHPQYGGDTSKKSLAGWPGQVLNAAWPLGVRNHSGGLQVKSTWPPIPQTAVVKTQHDEPFIYIYIYVYVYSCILFFETLDLPS